MELLSAFFFAGVGIVILLLGSRCPRAQFVKCMRKHTRDSVDKHGKKSA